MAYSEFTLPLLKDRFGITASDAENLFADIPPLPISDFFHILLKRHLPIVRGQGTEKARSEMIIAPLLVELRGQAGHEIAVFSGVEMSADPALGLYGFCDFLVSRSPTRLAVTSGTNWRFLRCMTL